MQSFESDKQFDCGYADIINKTINKYEKRFDKNELQYNRFNIDLTNAANQGLADSLPQSLQLPQHIEYEKCFSMATQLKRSADRQTDRTAKIQSYLHSALYFIAAANTSEKKCDSRPTVGQIERDMLYRDTLNFVRHVTDNFAKTRCLNEAYVPIIDNKLITLSYRCQSLLLLKMTELKRRDIRDNSTTIERMSQQLPQNILRTNSLVAVMNKQLNLLNGYNSAHNLWLRADHLNLKHSTCKAFFKLLDQECGVLCLNSSFDHLVNYVKTALRIMCKQSISLCKAETIHDYMSTARAMKHSADRETDRTKQVCKYLQAMLYFIVAANHMQHSITGNDVHKDMLSVHSIHNDTLTLLANIRNRFLKSRPLLDTDIPQTDYQIIALIYRCEALLYLNLTASKSSEITENSKVIQHQIQDLRLNNGVTHALVSIMQKQLASLHQYHSLHQLWQNADQFISKYESCETFFDSLNHECGLLSLTTTLDHFIDYMRIALQTLK